MRVGNFSAGLAKLHGAIDSLRHSWGDVHEQWDDRTSRNLLEQHIEPMLEQLREVIDATVPLQEVVSHAVRNCEP